MLMKLFEKQEVFLLDLSGDLDLYGSIQLKEIVMKLIENKVEHLIISLRDVKVINSSGIGALLYIYSTFMKMNLDLAITDVTDNVYEQIDITKTSKYLPITDSVKEACMAVGHGEA